MVIVHISDQAKAQAPRLEQLARQLDDVKVQLMDTMSQLGLGTASPGPSVSAVDFAGSTSTAFRTKAPSTANVASLASEVVDMLQRAYGLYTTDMQEVDHRAAAQLRAS